MINTSMRQRGFSLLELMITITVMAILLVIAVPSFQSAIHRNEVSSATNNLLASLAYARTEAINRGQLVSLCPSTDGANCTLGGQAYDPGWIVYTYPAGAASANKPADPTATLPSLLLRATAVQSGVSIQSLGTAVVTFGQQGQLDPSTTKLKFITCYRSGSSGVGTTSTAVPSVELDVNGSGSVSTYTGTACTPT